MSGSRSERERAVRRRQAFETLLGLLQPVTSVIDIPAETQLFRQGESADGVYFVMAGSVIMTLAARHPRRAATRPARKDEILGLGSVFSGKPAACTAEAKCKARVGFVPRKDFFEFFQANPEARLPILQLLSDEVNNCYDQIRSTVHAA